MRTLLPLLTIAVIFTILPGCRNSCQQICPRMQAYAEDCGFTVTSEEVRACVASQSGSASRDDRAVCRDAGDRSTLRDEWTCDDLSDYWARDAPVDTGAPESGL